MNSSIPVALGPISKSTGTKPKHHAEPPGMATKKPRMLPLTCKYPGPPPRGPANAVVANMEPAAPRGHDRLTDLEYNKQTVDQKLSEPQLDAELRMLLEGAQAALELLARG